MVILHHVFGLRINIEFRCWVCVCVRVRVCVCVCVCVCMHLFLCAQVYTEVIQCKFEKMG